MRPKQYPHLVIAVLAASARLHAAAHWIDLRTPHFEMFTDNSADDAAKALETFEQVRYFFLQLGKAHEVSTTPVRIIAFRSASEFRPYTTNAGQVAYYQRSRKCDYIVMQDLAENDHQVAVHEYTHLVIEHSGMNIPIWLNEGLADLYSSLEPRGDKALVGRAITNHILYLRNENWMDLHALFNVDEHSPYYNVPNKMSLFYAQSWALTHMLALDKRYMQNFPLFLAAVSSGKTPEESFASIYGKTVEQVTADLRGYVQRSSFLAFVFDVKLPKEDLEPEVSDLSDLNAGLALADLLASREGGQNLALARLDALLSKNPNNPDVEASLGYLAWQANDTKEARADFASAVKHGSKDVEMIYNYAELEGATGAPASRVIDLLSQAVQLDPSNTKYRLELGLRAAQDQKWGFALSQLTPIKQVAPGQAFSFFYTLALCHVQLKDLQNARAPANQALAYTKDPSEQQQVKQLISYIEGANRRPVRNAEPETAGPAEVAATIVDPPDDPKPQLSSASGTAKTFECSGKTYRLHLQVGPREMVFDLGDPKDISLINFKGDQLLWSCGPLHAEVLTILYDPSGSSAKVNGLVRQIVFK